MNCARLLAGAAHWLHQQWQRRGLAAGLLLPFAGITACYVVAKKIWYTSGLGQVYRAPVPVVVVGNVYVGGTGKTPVVIALVKQLEALGWHPGIISRGYGVRLGPHARSGRGVLQASVVGDEPALLAEQTGAPLGVHPKRRLACQALLQAYPQVDIIVADDGLQHLALARDFEIVVQDARGLGNGWLLPAGPLREPALRLSTADLVITRENAPSRLTAALRDPEATQHQPVGLRMWLKVTGLQSLDKKINISVDEFTQFRFRKNIIAIAAISEPDRFFNTLAQAELTPDQTLGLPDHHPLGASLFAEQTADLILLTTKDAVKCRDLTDPRIWVVLVEAVFSEADWVNELSQHLRATQSHSISKLPVV